jgi:hypothetical protein
MAIITIKVHYQNQDLVLEKTKNTKKMI